MTEDPFVGRLIDGERILWTGQPGQGLIFAPRDGLLIPFSLVWCGFAVFWTYSVATTTAPGFFTVWGLMFVCIGLYLVVGRFFVDAWIRRGMRYAVTDRRILIFRPAPLAKFTAVSLGHLPAVDLDERSRGQGTIRFGADTPAWGARGGMGVWTPAFDSTPQFLLIDDARRIFDLIQQAATRDGVAG